MSTYCNYSSKSIGFLSILFALTSWLHAQGIAANITNIIEPTGTLAAPTYVIDSDGRDKVSATVTVSFSEISQAPSVTGTFRIKAQLLDDGGNPVTLLGNTTFANSISQSITFADKEPPKSLNFEIQFDPAFDLGSGRNYTIRVWVQEQDPLNFSKPWFDVEGPDLSDSFVIVHFTNTASGDAARNARGYTTGLPAWSRTYSVEPDVGFDNTFRVNVPYFFARYDLGGTSESVGIRCVVTMHNDLDQVVALKNGGQYLVGLTMANMLTGGGLPNRPQPYQGNIPVLFEPTGQLDSVNRTYRVSVTMEHIEVAPSTYRADGGTGQTALQRLLHFNGNLSFGPRSAFFRWLSTAPTAVVAGVGSIQAQITVGSASGSIPGFAAYSFGNSTTRLTVSLLANGNAVVNAGALPMVVTGGGGINATYGGIVVNYPSVSLQSSGPVASSAIVRLPQGLGFNPDRSAQGMRYESSISFAGALSLSSSFDHSGTLSTALGGDAWVFDESRPMLYQAAEAKFTTLGNLSFLSSKNEWVHEQAMDDLATQQAAGDHKDPSMAIRLTNEGYLRYVVTSGSQNVDFRSANDGTVRTANAGMTIRPGEFHTHFPLDAKIKWDAQGVFEIKNGLVSGNLPQPKPFSIAYEAACLDADCALPGGMQSGIAATGYSENEWILSMDGGLRASCLSNPTRLEWGFKNNDAGNAVSTHRTDRFSSFEFFASGNQMYELNNPLLFNNASRDSASLSGPGCILLAGCNPSTPAQMVYPTTVPYIRGVGLYAGANFTVIEGNPNRGSSQIADMRLPSPYDLQADVSKYYVRRSGLSGRQVAAKDSFSPVAELYGYGFSFTSFQMTFLSNENKRSWIHGAVNVGHPSKFTQKFKELTLACNGALEEALIDPEDVAEKDLFYWDGKFTPQSMRFVAQADKPCGTRTLTIGLTSGAANLDFPLSGSLGFLPDGNIAPMSANLVGVDGRLGLPATVRMNGPGNEKYNIVPVSKLYFNHYAATGAPRIPNAGVPEPKGGYVGFAGRCNVPYFEDLKLHVMTSAKSSVPANIYLTGGWEEGGQTFFTNRNFDSNHRAFPAAAGLTVEDYRNPQRENRYVPRATQSIFGMVPLDYPLQWNAIGRYFRTWNGDRNVDLFVVTVQHQVKYLSANNAEITFGVQYDGLPRISLASAVFSEAEEQTGAVKAIVDATSSRLTNALYQGVDQIGTLVNEQFEAVLDEALDAMEDDVLRPLYGEVATAIRAAETGGAEYSTFATRNAGQLRTTLNQRFDAAGAGAARLGNRLKELASAANQAKSVMKRIDQALEDGELAIDSVAGQLRSYRDVNGVLTPLPSPQLGIIARSPGGERQIVQRLVTELLAELAPRGLGTTLFTASTGALTAGLNAKLNALLAETDPALDQIVTTLTEIKLTISTFRRQIAEGAGMIEEFQAILQGATGEIEGIIASVRTVTFNYLDQVAAASRIDVVPLNSERSLLDQFGEDEFVAMIRAELRDRLMLSNFVQQMQATLRGYISELELALNSAIDAAFAEVTELCRGLIDEFLGPIDDAINGLSGDINSYVGAGSIKGYAHIQGDTLRRLRIDAEIQLKVPDDMALKGFIEYNCFDSDTEGAGCVRPGTQTVEVKMGAIDAPLDWVNPGVKADLTVWFTMAVGSQPGSSSPIYPTGIGGSLVKKEGEINFESFKITKFGAAVAVGIDDCYLAATATVVISSYEATGGIFFGKSCSLAPLEMVDPEVAALVGPAPFTGAYVYGEVWIPLSETLLGIPASCLFRISAGLGAGAFYFQSGPNSTPTYGGKMLLGLSGEALCVVSIKGTVSMIGVMSNGSLRFSGTGTLTGKAGACPFCVKFRESAKMTYQRGSWDIDY